MSNSEKKERRCSSCKKLLLDEKLPYCRRCLLEKRNRIGAPIIFSLATVGIGAFLYEKSDGNNNTSV